MFYSEHLHTRCNNWWKTADTRFIEALKRRGHNIPEAEEPEFPPRPLLESINSTDFIYMESLKRQKKEDDWHYIHTYPCASDLTSRIFTHMAAPSLATALAGLLEEIDRARETFTNVSLEEDALKLWKGDSLAVEVGRMRFARLSSDELDRRVNKALKGMLWPRDQYRLATRLSKLPNIECEVGSPREQVGPLRFHPYQQLAANIRDVIIASAHEVYGVNLKNTEAQDIVVELFSFTNWHHVVSKEDGKCRVQPVALFYRCEDEERSETHYFRTIADAISAYSMEVKRLMKSNRTLLGRPSGELLITHDLLDEPEAILTIGFPDLFFGEGDYLASGKKIADATNVAKAMQQALGCDHDPQDRIAMANRRRHIEDFDEMWIGDWLFTINRAYSLPLLQGELWDDKKENCLRTFEAGQHKSTVGTKEDPDEPVIITEYGRLEAARFPDFSQDDMKKLADFFGIEHTY